MYILIRMTSLKYPAHPLSVETSLKACRHDCGFLEARSVGAVVAIFNFTTWAEATTRVGMAPPPSNHFPKIQFSHIRASRHVPLEIFQRKIITSTIFQQPTTHSEQDSTAHDRIPHYNPSSTHLQSPRPPNTIDTTTRRASSQQTTSTSPSTYFAKTMPRYPVRHGRDAHSITNRFNIQPHNRKVGFTFDELEKMYICDTYKDFPCCAEVVFRAQQRRRGGPLRDAHLASIIVRRYADKTPKDIRRRYRLYQHQRHIARIQQERNAALLFNTAGVTMLQRSRGSSMNQAHPVSGTTIGSQAPPALANMNQMREGRPPPMGGPRAMGNPRGSRPAQPEDFAPPESGLRSAPGAMIIEDSGGAPLQEQEGVLGEDSELRTMLTNFLTSTEYIEGQQ